MKLRQASLTRKRETRRVAAILSGWEERYLMVAQKPRAPNYELKQWHERIDTSFMIFFGFQRN